MGVWNRFSTFYAVEIWHAQPGDSLLALRAQRPFGLPSHAVRLNGAGHTGRRVLDVLKWASMPICPLTIRLIGASMSRQQAIPRMGVPEFNCVSS